MKRTPCFLLLVVAAALFVPCAAHAAQSYDNCAGFIASLPTTISTQGTWCMNKDLTTAITSGNAIVVNTNNVTIDCNDYKLGGLAAGVGTSTVGIYSFNRFNVTVRHCNIRGFYQGINLDGSGGGHVVEDNRFDGNTYYGLRISGDGSVARRNQVFDTGGSTVSADAFGLRTYGIVDVLDNTISNVVATSGGNGSGYGIYTYTDTSGSVSGNRVRGVLKDGTGAAYGIYNIGASVGIITGNHVVGDLSTGSDGIVCDGGAVSTSYNVVQDFATGIFLCGNDGGNIVKP